MVVHEQHAVGDVRQHAFGDRALVLREARAPECGREGIRHDHHGREDDEADEQDPVANLGRGCVDRPGRLEDREARARRDLGCDRAVAHATGIQCSG